MSDIEKIHGITPDLTRENVDRLLALFPDVATEITDPKTGRTERAVDFDALKERLGDVAEGNRERYQFTWPGKREAKRLAREPIAKTLRPVKERSKDWDTTRNLYIEGDNLDAFARTTPAKSSSSTSTLRTTQATTSSTKTTSVKPSPLTNLKAAITTTKVANSSPIRRATVASTPTGVP